MGQADEDQGTDNEICTVAAARVDSGGRKSPSAPTCDRPQGLYKNLKSFSMTVSKH